MMNLISKWKIYRRKVAIESTVSEMEHLVRLLDDTLNERGTLTRIQRMKVLLMLVERNRNRATGKVDTVKRELVEEETAMDVVKSIITFNL